MLTVYPKGCDLVLGSIRWQVNITEDIFFNFFNRAPCEWSQTCFCNTHMYLCHGYTFQCDAKHIRDDGY